MLCVLVAFQWVSLGHGLDDSTHAVTCPCVFADKVEWAHELIRREAITRVFEPPTVDAISMPIHAAPMPLKRARAPPSV